MGHSVTAAVVRSAITELSVLLVITFAKEYKVWMRWVQVSASIQTISALFWGITQRTVVIPCRRFGTTYTSHLQGSRSPRIMNFLDPEDGIKGCPYTSVSYYHSSLRNMPQERRSQNISLYVIFCGLFLLPTSSSQIFSLTLLVHSVCVRSLMWIIHIIYLVGEALVTISERWCNLLLHAQWAAACTARGEGADWQAKYHEAAGLWLLLLPLLLLLLLLLQGRLLHDEICFILSAAGMWFDTLSENFKMIGSRVISFK